MKKRRRILLLLTCGGLAAALCARLARTPDPIYNGRHLSEWVQMYEDAPKVTPSPQREAAAEAIQRIGTNAVPYLVRAIDYEEPSWREKLGELVPDDPPALLQGFERTLERPGAAARQAVGAFIVLGPQAECAIPQLKVLLNDPRREQTAGRVTGALEHIGRPALEALMSAATNRNLPDTTRVAVFVTIGCMRSDAASAVPLLMAEMKDQTSTFAGMAVGVLGDVGVDQAAVVTALIDALQDARHEVRSAAAEALGNGDFGKQATPAITPLLAALRDPRSEVREAATNALLQIAPQALTNTPPK